MTKASADIPAIVRASTIRTQPGIFGTPRIVVSVTCDSGVGTQILSQQVDHA